MLDRMIVWAAVGGAAALAGRELLACLRGEERARWGRFLAGLAVVLVLRGWLVAASTSHEGHHAGDLIDTILLGTEQPRIASWGPVSFEVLGAVGRTFGGGLASVIATNHVAGILALAAASVMARRLGGWPAATACLALGALYPPLARIVATEDAHPLAAVFALGALCWLDAWARDARRWRLPAAVLCVGLMLYTRQTFHPWAPCAVLVVLGLHGWGLLRRPPFAAAVGVMALLTGWRIVSSALSTTDEASLILLPATLQRPALWDDLVSLHPLVDIAAGPLLLTPLLLAGLWTSRRISGHRELWIALAILFLTSFPFGRPGASFCYRFPVFLLALVVAAQPLGRLVQWTRARGVAPAGILVAAVTLLPLLLPGRQSLQVQSDEYLEFAYLESIAPRLPPTFSVLDLPRMGWAPQVVVPTFPFVSSGREVRRASPGHAPDEDVPLLFYEGINCRVYTFMELAGLGEDAKRRLREPAFLDLLLPPAVTGRAPPGAAPTPGRRPACDALISRATPMDIPPGELAPTHVVPFAQFDTSTPVPLRFWRLDPAVVQGLSPEG